jgi:hypothetical protein
MVNLYTRESSLFCLDDERAYVMWDECSKNCVMSFRSSRVETRKEHNDLIPCPFYIQCKSLFSECCWIVVFFKNFTTLNICRLQALESMIFEEEWNKAKDWI